MGKRTKTERSEPEAQGALGIGTVPIVRFSDNECVETQDAVTLEEPLEISLDNEPFYLTMRTPGEEILLALGLCFTDGIINSIEDVATVNYCSSISRNKINVFLNPAIKKEAQVRARQTRFPTYSSCGICGKDMIEDTFKLLKRIEPTLALSISQISDMQKIVQKKQEIFPTTGGTHAAGIFGPQGDLLSISEDVGRHNAFDKAIGKLLFSRTIKKAAFAVLTSRLSFEMVQKAARLGVEVLCGASSPTSLAIDLAKDANITLIGFLRGKKGNIYTCPERITATSTSIKS